MPESYRQIHTQFVDKSIPRYVRRSFRLVPDYQTPLPELRSADINKWYEIGFDELHADGLAAIVYEDEQYVILSQVKNATDTDYDIMFICIPQKGQEIHHLPCFLPKRVTDAFYEALNRGVEAIYQTAKTNNEQIRRLYVHHHVGPFELNSYPFNISFPHLHMHVMAVCDRDLEECEHGLSKSELRKPDNRYTYSDPSVLIAKDIFERTYQKPVAIDYSTSSLILSTNPLDLKISQAEKDFLPPFYYEWHKWWAMVALAFSHLSLDSNQRLDLTLSPEDRVLMVEALKDFFPIFSQQSQVILTFLAENAIPFDPSRPTQSTYAGVAGAVGWVHNFDNQTTQLRFGPRLLTSSKKMGASDGFYVGIKDKSQLYPQAENRLKIQRQIFATLKEITRQNPINQIRWENVTSLQSLTAVAKTKSHHSGIFFTDSEVIKTKNRFTPEQTIAQYEKMKKSKLPLGAPPRFIKDEHGSWAEVNDRIYGQSGDEFLAHAEDEESLAFFEQVILASIDTVFAQNEEQKLVWSIDALPHNFVFDSSQEKFVYIDYEPSHLIKKHHHFLIPEKLINYALVKFGREKPRLFPLAFDLTCKHFPPEIAAYLNSLPYSQLLLGKTNFRELLDQTSTKDDLLGLLVAWISKLSEREIVHIGSMLQEWQLTNHPIQSTSELIEILAYKVCKNDPEQLRSILAEIWKQSE